MADAALLSSPSPSPSPSELASMLPGSLQLHQFCLGPDERPQVAYDQFEKEDELPVVDLGILRSGSYHDKTDCLRKMVRACKEWGFFRLVNHGLPVELIREMDAEVRKVFSLPFEAKLQIHDPENSGYGFSSGSQDDYNFRGYWHEALRFHGESKFRKKFVEKTMPPNVNDFSDTLEEYMGSMEKLAREVATHLAVALGLPSGSFSDACKGLLMRFNHYPACPQPLSTLGLLSHTDGFVLTILHEDRVGGLQILKKKQLKQQQQQEEEHNYKWISVRPQFGSFIVNVGDILQVWSNEILTSVVHRAVVNSKCSRFSMAYFFGPEPTSIIQPEPKLASDEHPLVKFRSFTFEEYFRTATTLKFLCTLDSFRLTHSSC